MTTNEDSSDPTPVYANESGNRRVLLGRVQRSMSGGGSIEFVDDRNAAGFANFQIVCTRPGQRPFVVNLSPSKTGELRRAIDTFSARLEDDGIRGAPPTPRAADGDVQPTYRAAADATHRAPGRPRGRVAP